MLLNILNIVAPVFLVIGAGYLFVHRGWFVEGLVDGLMKYAIQLAVPCLLFRATSTMDLASAYDWRIMLSFYLAASVSFFSVSLAVWKWFGRKPAESVAIGFAALFSNSILLGLPISERAWGASNLSEVYAIVSVHAPFCYLLGITTMEIIRSDGRRWRETARIVAGAMFSNSLMIGIGLGFLVNLSGLVLPQMVTSAVDIISASALPVALFGLGGILARYRFASDLRLVATVSAFSLVVHPALTLLLCSLLQVDPTLARTAILVAAMAPGINSYLFASMYQRGQSVAASSVLLGTGISVLSVSVWLWLLSEIQSIEG
ncbi:MAG: AEC family transporter [Candidatus Thiodiazotropha sp.]